MSSFDPDNEAVADYRLTAALLSQRDVSSQIPLNFVTRQTVSLFAACFGHDIYTQDGARKCLANLLSAGYRRLVVDCYWDVQRRVWAFCPVEVPTGASETATATTAASTATATATSTDSDGKGIYQLGRHRCDAALTIDDLADVVSDYLQTTQNTIDANIISLIFNLHAAASSSNPDAPATQVGDEELPRNSDQIGEIMEDAMGSYLYTPETLERERRDMNSSWYSVRSEYLVAQEYFQVDVDGNNIHSTPDGWPAEIYVQYVLAKRMLLGWGEVDPQMSGYAFQEDAQRVFPSGYTMTEEDVVVDANGNITQGCFYEAGVMDIARLNNSWATNSLITGFEYPVTASASLDSLEALDNSLIDCGVSSSLNNTLLNATADTDATPYLTAASTQIWSWASTEPRNTTKANEHCAVMNITNTGRWEVADCTKEYYAACQTAKDPYTWTLTSKKVTFSSATKTCTSQDSNTTFAVPRTALENTHLYHTVSSTSDNPTLIWLSFNSADTYQCWVPGALNQTCPYTTSAEQDQRLVLVPLVAALVVLAVTALTLFVKCTGTGSGRGYAAKRRKRALGGWEYEGVPS